MKFHNPDAETFPWVMGVKFIQTKKGKMTLGYWVIRKSHFVLLLATTHRLIQLAVWISEVTRFADFLRDLS